MKAQASSAPMEQLSTPATRILTTRSAVQVKSMHNDIVHALADAGGEKAIQRLVCAVNSGPNAMPDLPPAFGEPLLCAEGRSMRKNDLPSELKATTEHLDNDTHTHAPHGLPPQPLIVECLKLPQQKTQFETTGMPQENKTTQHD